MGNLARRYVEVAPDTQSADTKREPVKQVANKRVANMPVVANKVASKPKRDRAEYQRELMRKRRAKEKLA